MPPELETTLRDVSRSFYLTLRLLPSSVRPPISLAYLLARASDTVADAGKALIADRLAALKALMDGTWTSRHADAFAGSLSPKEKALLDHLPRILEAVGNSPEKAAILKVWRTIMEGQEFDLIRFGESQGQPLGVLERDRYTYMVAGCVGEFWTDICARHVIPFSTLPVSTMRDHGMAFGCGLQLVNILRDRGADAKNGRVYVRDDEFSAVMAQARQFLFQGAEYVASLRSGRLRYACLLPLVFAERTLNLIGSSPETECPRITRGQIRRWMVVSLPVLLVPGMTRPLLRWAHEQRGNRGCDRQACAS